MSAVFTGRRMAIVMIGFFGVVLAVNLLMAHYAASTFSGTVVDNSYVASQSYNRWLGEARTQAALGWKVVVDVDPARHVQITVGGPDGALTGAQVRAVARHPLGRIADQPLVFRALGNGRFVATQALLPGRFRLRIHVSSGGRNAAFDDEVPA